MLDDASQANLRVLLRIAAASTAIGFGSVTGSLYSLRQGPSGMTFEFSTGTVVAFLIGAICGWFYWHVVGRMIVRGEMANASQRKRFIVFNIFVCVIGLLAFLYPIRFVQRERMRDVVEGMGLAFFVLALVGVALWRVIKFFNQDTDSHAPRE